MAQMDMALPVPGIPPLSMEMLKKGKTAGVTLVQPVFMGGRIVNGNKLANIGKQVSEYQLSLTEDQVEASVNQYYWQIVALKEKLRTLETLETQLKGIYKDVKAAVDAGLTIRNDLLRVELQQQDFMANRLKVENGLSVTKMLLCQLIGVDKSEFDIAFDDFPSAVSPLDYYVAPETGLENRTYRRHIREIIGKSLFGSLFGSLDFKPAVFHFCTIFQCQCSTFFECIKFLRI